MIAASLKSLFKVHEVSAEDPAERRADPRRRVLLKAEIYPIIALAEMAVTNVSKGGLAAETDANVQVGQPLLFSLDGKSFHRGIVRWKRGRRLGLNLENALAVCGLEDETDHGFLGEHQARATRHEVQLSAKVAVGSLSYRSTVRDVSQSGLRLETSVLLTEGQQVIIGLKDRPLILAIVQWVSGGLVGVRTVERMMTLRLVYSYE